MPVNDNAALTIFLPVTLKGRLAKGHPWVYRSQIPPEAQRELARLPAGTWVQVRCGGFSAYGLYDRTGQIAVRLFSTQQIPDYAWFYTKLEHATQNRELLQSSTDEPTNAYRLLFGEGDGLPGLTVDIYADYAVAATYSESTEVLLPWLVEALPALVQVKGLVRRTPRRAEIAEAGEAENLRSGNAAGKLTALMGRLPPRELVVLENGLKFKANLFEGQKTGLFLDHRDNRRYLQDWTSGKRVLNCFSYTGAFSVYALRGGATEVVSCDIAPAATAAAQDNFRLNGFDPDDHEFISADCFELLADYDKQGRKFDLIILDPPSFAHSIDKVYSALRAYTRLNKLALALLEPGGLLASASCTSYVSPENFRDMLADAAAQAKVRLQILHDAGHPPDHPVPPHFLEGRYLKFMLCRAHPTD